jgi:hypothetical protein
MCCSCRIKLCTLVTWDQLVTHFTFRFNHDRSVKLKVAVCAWFLMCRKKIQKTGHLSERNACSANSRDYLKVFHHVTMNVLNGQHWNILLCWKDVSYKFNRISSDLLARIRKILPILRFRNSIQEGIHIHTWVQTLCYVIQFPAVLGSAAMCFTAGSAYDILCLLICDNAPYFYVQFQWWSTKVRKSVPLSFEQSEVSVNFSG